MLAAFVWCATPTAFAEPVKTNDITLSLPGLTWALEIDAPSFKIVDKEFTRDGKNVRIEAERTQPHIIISAFLEEAAGKGSAVECRDYYWAKAQEGLKMIKRDDLKVYESDGMGFVEYTIKEFQGRKVNQKNINAFLAKDGYWIHIHISKGDFKLEDDASLRTILKEIRINDHFTPLADECASFGLFFYGKKQYTKAIPYYEKALELDNTSPAFSRTARRDIMDELITAYGISGNLQKAKELCESGLRKEPEYSLFYYNLACAYAEMGDKKQAIENLRKAYQYKNKLPNDKELPDAKADPSFARYLSDPDFAKALEEMAK